MDMQGSRTLAVSQQQAWDALNDPNVLKLCVPGCDRMDATEPNHYAIGMALKIGPVSARFSGKIALADIVPPHSYTLSFDGQGGVAGFGKGSAQVKLTPLDAANGANACELAYSVNASVGGKIAQLGQRLIDGAAKSLAEDFFKRFDDEMQRLYPALTAAVSASAPDSGATQAGAHDAVSGWRSVPAWTWAAAALAALLLVWFLR